MSLASDMPTRTISINRAPVLTLWAAVVAQRLGFNEGEALSLGKALAGLNAQAKGRTAPCPLFDRAARRASVRDAMIWGWL